MDNVDTIAAQLEYRSHRTLRRNAIITAAIIVGLDLIAVAAVLLLVK